MAKETGFLPYSLVKYITCLLDRGYYYHLWKITSCSIKYFEQCILIWNKQDSTMITYFQKYTSRTKHIQMRDLFYHESILY